MDPNVVSLIWNGLLSAGLPALLMAVAVWPGVFRWLIEGLRVFDRG